MTDSNINNMETMRELFDLVDKAVFPIVADKNRANKLLDKISAINGWQRKPKNDMPQMMRPVNDYRRK